MTVRHYHRAHCIATLLVALLITGPIPAAAQLLREDFWVPDNNVFDVAVGDGVVYLAGGFSQVGPATGPFVGFDATTGTPLAPYPKVDGLIRGVVSDGAGGWYVGGHFTAVRGQPRSNLAHIDAAGNVTGWNPGLSGNVYCLARDFSTGIVYVGGNFNSIGGQSRHGLAAVDPDGALVAGWDAGFAPASSVLALSLFSGTLYAAGSFTSVAGQTRNRGASFDPATGALTGWDPDFDAAVLAIAPRLSVGFPSTVTIFAGGLFTSAGGSGRIRLAAVDGTTGAALPWNPGADAPVWAIALAGGSNPITNPLRVYVGGEFQLIASSPRSRIAQITESGSVAAWNPGASATVRALWTAGNLLYVGGDFASIGGQSIRYLAAVDRTTGLATGWDPMVGGGRVLAIWSTGSAVFAGGEFWTAGGVKRNRLAAIDLGTGKATAWNPDADAPVRTLALGDGVLYAGGDFATIGGQSRSRIAAFDVATGGLTSWSPTADGPIDDLAIGSGVVYAGGFYNTIGGQPRSRLAALDLATGLATEWSPSPNGGVSAIAVSGARVYVGGSFSSIGGQAVAHLAALGASTGLAVPWDPQVKPDPSRGFVLIESIVPLGKNVIVGGAFGEIGGRPRSHLAAVDTATALANHWDHYAHDMVNGLALEGAALYVGGWFPFFAGEWRSGLAAIDTGTGAILPWSVGVYTTAGPIAVRDGTLYATGLFQSAHRTFAVFSTVVAAVAHTEVAAPGSPLRAAPNPFRSEVALRFTLTQAADLDVTIHDVAGRVVRRLARGAREAGEHRVTWDGRDAGGRPVGTGVYLARVESGAFRQTAKVLRVN